MQGGGSQIKMATNFLRWLIFPPISLLGAMIIATFVKWTANSTLGFFLSGSFVLDLLHSYVLGTASTLIAFQIIPSDNKTVAISAATWCTMFSTVIFFMALSLNGDTVTYGIRWLITILGGVLSSFVLKKE